MANTTTFYRQRWRPLSTPAEEVGQYQTTYWTNPFVPQMFQLNTGSEGYSGFVNRGPPYKSGGPWSLTRTRVHRGVSASVDLKTVGVPRAHYIGRFVGPLPGLLNPTTIDLDALGTQMILKTIPTAPGASLSQFIYELKDVPGMLMQTKDLLGWMYRNGKAMTRNPKLRIRDAIRAMRSPGNLAGDYLNLQFGWMPVIGDLVKFYKLGQTIDKRVKFIREHNMGKPVNRRRQLKDTIEVSLLESYENKSGPAVPTLSPVVSTLFYATERPNGTRYRRQVTKTRTWFQATYKYYSPELAMMPDWVIKMDLYGLRLDPAVIYTVTPWSWLFDWFSTAGTSLRNMVEMSKYHTVIHHGYMMSNQSVLHEIECSQVMVDPTSASIHRLSATSTALTEWKNRKAASPYGFAKDWAEFTPYQLSILAALGISRGM